MNNEQAYNQWSSTYDKVVNKTRDLEAMALRSVLSTIAFDTVLEIGCGTGKNTEWIAAESKQVTSVDFSAEMLNKAKQKINNDGVAFIQADITQQWNFTTKKYDLVTCSLILEHIENIHFVFEQVNFVLKPNGIFYIGELHPFKQYSGSKARFEKENGIFELECFVHHVSDYFNAGIKNNFECVDLKEWFDEGNGKSIPRLLSMLFKRKAE